MKSTVAAAEVCRHKRVEPWKVRRLYKLSGIGIYDDELLLDVGWGLYVRCEDVLLVCRAVQDGELPCPSCGEAVHRPRHSRQRTRTTTSALNLAFACPSCTRQVTWHDCRESLRMYPACLECSHPMRWQHAEEALTCDGCGEHIEWRQYRLRIRTRRRLPCPHCRRVIARPRADGLKRPRMGDVGVQPQTYTCSRCGGDGVHEPGKFRCLACGRTQRWEAFWRRVKRKAERLACDACGLTFTWQQWRAHYRGRNLQMGNRPAVEAFLSQWPRCRDERAQLTLVDTLIHALHARGSIAPMLIRGSDESVKQLLDGLAGVC